MGGESSVGRAYTYLGKREETLGDSNDILHLLNRFDALLHYLGVLGARRVEDVPNTFDVALSPIAVGLLHSLWRTIVSTRIAGTSE